MGLFAFESKHAVKISKSFCGVSKSNDFRHVDMEEENNDALRIQQHSMETSLLIYFAKVFPLCPDFT